MGETTTLHIPFAGGLDEKLAKEYLDASSRQASIINGDFVKVGAIDKRNGLAHLPTTLIAGGTLPALSTGTRVVGWSRSSLSVLCSTGLYQYVSTSASVGGATAGGVVGVSQLPAVVASRTHVTTGDEPTSPVLVDLTYSGQLLRIVVAYDAADNLQASVYDVASGNIILEPTKIYTNAGTRVAGTIPRVLSGFDLPGIANGSARTVIVIWDFQTSAVKYLQYNPSTNAFTAPTTMVASTNVADVAVYEDDPANGWLVLYNTDATHMRLAYWTTAGLQTTVDQVITETLYFPCYVVGRYAQSVFTLWSTSVSGPSRVKHYAHQHAGDHAFASGMAAPYNFATVDITGLALGGILGPPVHLGTNKILVSYAGQTLLSATGPATTFPYWEVLSYSAPNISAWATGVGSLGLVAATRPFVVNGEVYQPFYYDLDIYNSANFTVANRSQQTTLYLCKYWGVSDSMSTTTDVFTSLRPVATIAPRTAIASNPLQSLADLVGLLHCVAPSTTARTATRVAIGLKTKGDSAGVAGPSWAVDFLWDTSNARNLYQPSELGSELSIAAGVPMVADGQIALEDGFFNYPEMSYVALEGAATPLATGTYTFAVCYRATDSAGLTHRSAPYFCTPTAVTGGGAGPALYITPPVASYRDALAILGDVGRIIADVYMTTVNGGTFYYKDSIAVSNIFPWPTAVRYPASGQVSAVPPTTNPLIYTTGGIMDNVNPPASRIQITHQSRKAIVDETLQQVWFSKQFVPGEAPGFNEALVIPYPDGGEITALGSMDGKFVVFKNRSIWIMEGEGPAVTGQGSSWTQPDSISTDVGAKSWQSVVLMPRGLMFQAANNGIYLLGRDLQVTFIGKNVIDETNAYPMLISARLVASSTQVRFVCQDAAGANQIVIVYDYLLDQWTTHKYAQLSALVASTCVSFEATPRFTVLTTDGKLYQERLTTDAARYLDADSSNVNHFVPTTIKLAHIKTQVQGYQRARRVQFFGEQQDDCGLQMQLGFNYDDTVKQTATWTSTELKALNVRGQVEAFVAAAYNKQMSVQITLSDTAGTAMTSGGGMRFAAVALELQSLGDRYRLTAAGARR